MCILILLIDVILCYVKKVINDTEKHWCKRKYQSIAILQTLHSEYLSFLAVPQIEYCCIISILRNLVGWSKVAAFKKYWNQWFIWTEEPFSCCVWLPCVSTSLKKRLLLHQHWPTFYIMDFLPTLWAGKLKSDKIISTPCCLWLNIIWYLSALCRIKSIETKSWLWHEESEMVIL